LKTSGCLVVGGGLAGLSLSLRASKKTPVTILTKASLLDSNSYMVQGGIASVMKPPDSFESHINDTLKAGQGLCNREAVEVSTIGGGWSTQVTSRDTKSREF